MGVSSNGEIRWNRAANLPGRLGKCGTEYGQWDASRPARHLGSGLGHNHTPARSLASKIDAAQFSPRSPSRSILGIPRIPTSLVPLPMPPHLISSHLSSRVESRPPFRSASISRHPCSLPSSWRRAPPSHIPSFRPPPGPIPIRAPNLSSIDSTQHHPTLDRDQSLEPLAQAPSRLSTQPSPSGLLSLPVPCPHQALLESLVSTINLGYQAPLGGLPACGIATTLTMATPADCQMLGDVQDLFPTVLTAVDKFRSTKPDAESRSVARGLNTEAALYRRLIAKILLLADVPSIRDPNLHQNVTAKVGVERTALLLTHLKEMHRLLTTLIWDFGNTSRGTVRLLSRTQQCGIQTDNPRRHSSASSNLKPPAPRPMCQNQRCSAASTRSPAPMSN